MTAPTTSGRVDKKVSRPQDVDAETLLAFVQEQQKTTLKEIAVRLGLTERETRSYLVELRERDLVDVEPGLRAVWVYTTERGEQLGDDPRGEPVPDGGAVQQLIHALTQSSETVHLSEEELYDCLSNPRRRRILRYLAAFYDDHARVYVDVETLADALADRITDEDPDPAREDQLRHRHYTSITQVHAPRLDELGLVEYYETVSKLRATEDGVTVASLMTEISELCDGDGREGES